MHPYEIYDEHLRIEPLTNGTDVSRFDCGNENINDILRHEARILQRKHKAVTHLFYIEDELVAFCTLLADTVSVFQREDRFPNGRHPNYYPAVQLYALGVSKRKQAEKIGSYILQMIIGSVNEIREFIGIRFIALEAFDDEHLIRFYTDNDFERWESGKDTDDGLVPMVYDFQQLDEDVV